VKYLTLALALALPLSAFAETREERVAVAAEYVELALQGFDMAAMIETMYQPVLQQVAAGGQTLSEAQVGQIRQLYLDTFTAPMTTLMRDQAGLMADMMTLDEITALRHARRPVGDGETAAAYRGPAARDHGADQRQHDHADAQGAGGDQ
jgi:hypothetical protein